MNKNTDQVKIIKSNQFSYLIFKVSGIIISWFALSFFVAQLTKAHTLGAIGLKEPLGSIAKVLVDGPYFIVKTILDIRATIKEEPYLLIVPKRKAEANKQDSKIPCGEDEGYVLWSGLDSHSKVGIVQLIRLKDGVVIKRWDPDWNKIYENQSVENGIILSKYSGNLLAEHPLILSNGNLCFLAGKCYVVMVATNGWKTVAISTPAHHSIEISENAEYLYSAGHATDTFLDNEHLNSKVLDDSILKISFSGSIIENRSFYKILESNNLAGDMFGHSGLHEVSDDLVHINQISVAKADTAVWKSGDLLISARHNSTLYLYRPSNNKILWKESGPWKNQHSVHFVDDSSIALLDNNVYGSYSRRQKPFNFVKECDINRVFVINFAGTRSTYTQPFAHILEKEGVRPATVTEGRARVLPDGGLFFEESNYGRHIRINKSNVMWISDNHYDDHRNGLVKWSRYLTKDEGELCVSKIKQNEFFE